MAWPRKANQNTTPLNVAVLNTSLVLKSGTASKNSLIAENILEYIIDQGADISGNDENGMTPLNKAARSNNIFATRLLLESGAPVMQTDFYNRPHLHHAQSRELEKILIEYGAVETEDPFPDFEKRKR